MVDSRQVYRGNVPWMIPDRSIEAMSDVDSRLVYRSNVPWLIPDRSIEAMCHG